MKLSFATRAFPLMVAFGILSVACGGSSSETPMPLEPVPHSGPEPEFPPEEDEDPPEAPEIAPPAPAEPFVPSEPVEPEPLPPATTDVEPQPGTPPPPAPEPAPPAPPLD